MAGGLSNGSPQFGESTGPKSEQPGVSRKLAIKGVRSALQTPKEKMKLMIIAVSWVWRN